MVLGHILTSERTQDIQISEDVTFESLLLSPNTLKGLKSSRFYVPSPIQLHGIPLGKCGFDLLLEAKSGTGKTAVFSVIALEKLDLDKGVQTLVLAPTREIASQICDVIKTIGTSFKGLSVEVVMGGLSFEEDVAKFEKKVHIVVGSPGRLHYLIKQKHIDVSSVRLMVLDEADKLVEKSFLPDINYIFSQLPSQKQIIMSSATYPENVKTVMRKYVQNAHHICPDSSSVLRGIEQNVVVVPSHVNIVNQTKNRYKELNQILSKKKFKQCLVFCNYQVRVGEVHKLLKKDKWPADKLHGKQQQTDRLEALKVLQEYQCRILVTTDLTARGIDASNVDLVINFEIPYDWQTYLHRIGRAGRYGSYGSAISILCEGDEEKKFKKLLGSINISFHLKYLWSDKPFQLDFLNKTEEICHKQNKSDPEIKEPEIILGVKETYEEIWKVLSTDSNQLKMEIHDIPTFESLCESFEQTNRGSNNDNIESFPDLLSSFENHTIKSYENVNYKTVEVNTLIKPCTILNNNIFLQSYQQQNSRLLIADNNKNGNTTSSKLVENELESKDCQLSKSKHVRKSENEIRELRNNKYEDTDSGSESCENDFETSRKEGSLKSKYNAKEKQTEKCISEIENSTTAPGCSKYKTNIKYNVNRETKRKEWSNHSKRICEVQMSRTKKSSKNSVSDDQKYIDESDSNSYNSDHNNNFVSPEQNYNEKSLLAANLPTAFGKSKQKKSIQSEKHRYNANKKKISKRSSEYQVEEPKIRTKSNINQRQDTEPSDSDETISLSYKLGSETKTKKNSANDNCGAYSHVNVHNLYRKMMEQRQSEFDLWYQQLKTQMIMIERSVYIEEMSRLY